MDGSVTFEGVRGYLGPEQVFDAEEYFQHREDVRLGRWRWPENPDYVVYRRGDGLLALNEQSGNTKFHDIRTNRSGTWTNGSILDEAIRAYFEAHPERKPWHDAEPGDVWVLTVLGHTLAWVADGDGYFQHLVDPESLRVTDPDISDGRRIYPDDAS
ncbi:hypothetical protein [Microbacterium algeriense]|uniref:hypothetical protein n=1 Tax=Microbacterium algeriense TaxID=2615184 RepID=UPI003D75B105